MGYLFSKFKGKYRIKCEYDQSTFDFNRKLNGTYEDIDTYIKCKNDIKIFHYGGQTLQFYCPSVQRGNGIVRKIYRDFINKDNTVTTITEIERDGKVVQRESIQIISDSQFDEDIKKNKFIYDIERTDSEVLFKFSVKNMELFEKYFEPSTSGANISPFSSKNLPKCDYEIPEEDLVRYKQALGENPKEKLLQIRNATNGFLEALTTKKYKIEHIKADMKKTRMRTKEYIHSIGKWNDYIKYLEKNLED